MALKWYAVPVVSNMIFDVGGIFFPACAFSGWYMNTEIARDFCDVTRYNLTEVLRTRFIKSFSDLFMSSLEKHAAGCHSTCVLIFSQDIANVFGLDTSKISSLWKDQTFLELNKAILYSFQVG